MTNSNEGTDNAAASQDSTNAQASLGGADADLADYMENVNAQQSAGNPYESKQYLEEQNLATSGAMNSEKGATDEALGHTVATTGTNSAALADTEAEAGRQGARDLTQYTAGRDTSNEDKWLQDQQSLNRDQLAGAQEEGSLYSTATSGQDSTLSSATSAGNAEDEEWAQLGQGAMTGLGSGLGGAFSG